MTPDGMRVVALATRFDVDRITHVCELSGDRWVHCLPVRGTVDAPCVVAPFVEGVAYGGVPASVSAAIAFWFDHGWHYDGDEKAPVWWTLTSSLNPSSVPFTPLLMQDVTESVVPSFSGYRFGSDFDVHISVGFPRIRL